jgi:hypothetical protein
VRADGLETKESNCVYLFVCSTQLCITGKGTREEKKRVASDFSL